MSETFSFEAGPGPLLIAIPHAGVEIPEDMKADYTAAGLSSGDADLDIDRLYKGLEWAKITARYSRYVIDLNRPREDYDLYPGQFTTGLFPVTSFDKEPLYKPGRSPGPKAMAKRIEDYYTPYHRKIAEVLAQKRKQHRVALLWDAHSIKSRVPSLFQGKLPDFNFGTDAGKSCGLDIKDPFTKVMRDNFPQYSFIFDGRFKGGYTTRHYGAPDENIHAVQLELSQAAYIDEATGKFAHQKAAVVKKAVKRLLEVYQSLASGKNG